MKVLKVGALALLSLILFLTLIVFGLAYTVNQVVLSPGTIKGIIHDVDFAQLAALSFNQNQSDLTQAQSEMQKTVIDTVSDLQPLLKEKLNIVIDGAYASLRGGKKAPDLKVVLGQSFMNADFVEKLLANVNLSNLVEQTLNEQSNGGGDSGQALQQAVLTTLEKIEPEFKKQVVAASDPVLKYILGQTGTIDLKATARNTFLSDRFIFTLVDNVDIELLVRDMINEQLGPLLEGFTLTDSQLDRIVIMLEPEIKNQLNIATGPIADYIVGKTTGFNISVSFQSVLSELKPVVREIYLANLPAEFQNADQAQIDQAIEIFWNDLQRILPSTLIINETTFGAGMNTSLNQAFADLEDGLNQARDEINDANQTVESKMSELRTYVGYFRTGFAVLIASILIIMAGITLIHRSVRGACRHLGITILIYGALSFTAIMLIRNVLPDVIIQNTLNIPSALSESGLIPMLLKRLSSPLFTVSLVCMIVGVLSIVVSVVYPRMQAGKILAKTTHS